MTGRDERREVFEHMAREVKKVNFANGWFDKERSIGDGMALLHSEVSEAFDAWCKHGFEDIGTHEGMCSRFTDPDPATGPNACDCNLKPEGYSSELADVLIRLLDQADRDGVDLVAEFERKLAYNRTRGYRHGNRKV